MGRTMLGGTAGRAVQRRKAQEVGVDQAERQARRSQKMKDKLLQCDDAHPPDIRVFETSSFLDRAKTIMDPLGQYESIIMHRHFTGFIYAAVLINALQMGLQVDVKGPTWDVVWMVLDYFFTFVFAIEMVLKIAILQEHYFYDKWNCLDFFIAWTSITDTLIMPAILQDGHESMSSVMQTFQFLRLIRMVKILRMKRELMALITGIIASVRSMCWISLLLLGIIYTCGIFCATMIGQADYGEEWAVDNYFGSLPLSMMTLFNMCILDQWSTIITPVSHVQWYIIPFFLVFLVMTSFGLMNAMIGIIVEQTTSATQRMNEADKDAERQERLLKIQSLLDVVGEIDQEGDGNITMEEFEEAENNPRLRDILASIDLPPAFSCTDLFVMLDKEGDGELSAQEFFNGMYQLIFCDDFQNQCLAKLAVAEIKMAIFRLKKEIGEDIKRFTQELANQSSQHSDSIDMASAMGCGSSPSLTRDVDPPEIARLCPELREVGSDNTETDAGEQIGDEGETTTTTTGAAASTHSASLGRPEEAVHLERPSHGKHADKHSRKLGAVVQVPAAPPPLGEEKSQTIPGAPHVRSGADAAAGGAAAGARSNVAAGSSSRTAGPPLPPCADRGSGEDVGGANNAEYNETNEKQPARKPIRKKKKRPSSSAIIAEGATGSASGNRGGATLGSAGRSLRPSSAPTAAASGDSVGDSAGRSPTTTSPAPQQYGSLFEDGSPS